MLRRFHCKSNFKVKNTTKKSYSSVLMETAQWICNFAKALNLRILARYEAKIRPLWYILPNNFITTTFFKNLNVTVQIFERCCSYKIIRQNVTGGSDFCITSTSVQTCISCFKKVSNTSLPIASLHKPRQIIETTIKLQPKRPRPLMLI